jgi:peptidyl-prolyl cis-trans isomerase A (cyclophilin A)
MLQLMFLSAVLLGGSMSAQAAPKQTATIETSMGTIVAELYPDQSPNTVANFVGLATGTKEYTDPKTGAKKKGKFYDGVVFHRVIPGFMIQGGDPEGTGRGGPGYKFADEHPTAKFDRPGRLAMANAGPNTNGSQFFITVANAEFLNTNGHYTIFGQVIKGQEVADAISKVARDANDRPNTPVTIKTIKVETAK